MDRHTARLEVVAGNAVGMSILVEDELIIGRHAQGPGRLADDEEISRSHARITVEQSGFCAIEDLGSTNGTFVNGLRISAPHPLAEGDMVELGATTLVVRSVPSLAGDEEPPTAPVDAAPRQPTAVSEILPPVAGIAFGEPVAEEPQQAPPAAEQDLRAAEAVPPPLALRLQVDFAARSAQITLEDSSASVRLEFIDGAWRVAPAPD